MKTIWDLYDENDIHSLLSNTESPDLNAILSHSEIFQLFRENDPDLIKFFDNQQIFQKILQTMTQNKDKKISKLVVELFLFKDSILLKKLFIDQKIVEDLIQSINDTNETKNDKTVSLSKEDRLICIGYISRIFIHALSIPEYKQNILTLFSSAPATLATLSKHADITSIFDLLQAYLNLLKPEEQWILFSYLQVLLPKGKSASCPKCFLQYKNLIIIIIKEMATISPLSNEIKANLLCLISNTFKNSIEVENNANTDVINAISTNLASIFNLPESSEELKVLILQLAMVIPPERSLLNIAAVLIKNSNSKQFTPVNVAALDLLSVTPSKTLSVLLPTIIKNFMNDKTNSFHHLSFLNFITSTVSKVPEMRGPIAKEMCPIILSESSGNEKWRKNAQRVGFFLQMAESIDQYVDELASSGVIDKSTFDSWKSFRNADLKKWKLKDSEKVDAPEAVAMSSSSKKSNLAAAVAAEEEASLAKAKSVSSPSSDESSSSTKKDSSSSKNNDFGDFSNEFQPTGSFPKDEKTDNAGFGGFDNAFPSADAFPKEEEKKDNNSGFGGFVFGDGFPPTDSFPKDEKTDNAGFGGFDNGFPSADAFPKEEEKKDNNSGFGGFGFGDGFPPTDSFPKDEKDDNNGFGGFDNAFPSADAFPKEEKDDNNGFGGFGNSFPSADAFPKEEKDDNNGFGGFGNAFPSADAFPKEEKDDNSGFGGFGNAFPSADAFPKEEKDDNGGFGGFGNAFPSADAFQKDEEKTDGGFGGFPPVDSFTGSQADEDKSQKDKDVKFSSATVEDSSSKKAQGKSNDEDEEAKKDEGEEDDEDDSDFEDLSAQPQQTERKQELSKPAPMPVFSQPKPSSNEPVDISFNHFLDLINNECWTYTGPTPAELFGQKDAFSTAEEAFNFLVGKSA